MIKFQCDKCKQGYNVPDKYAGKQTKCRQCNFLITVPALTPAKTACDEEDYTDDFVKRNMEILEALLKHEKEAPSIEVENP